ncbi:MAG: cytochrome c [Myxococcales bacterium]|nr:cytochrome c [Myxococcales bacterium]
MKRNMLTQRTRWWATAAALALLLPACRGMVSRKPPVHLNPNMDNVTRVEAQEPSQFWEDGRGMRPQVEGTVAQGELHADPHMYEGRDGRRWATTLPQGLALAPNGNVSHELVARGQQRFGIYCTPCHGLAGLENGGAVPIRAAAIGTAWTVPSLHGDRQRDYAIGELFHIVSNGYNTMPGYKAQIPVEDRWAIATYVRALQIAHEVPGSLLPNEVRQQQGWN